MATPRRIPAKKAAAKKAVATVVSAVAPRTFMPPVVTPTRKMEQKPINHIVFVLDESSSMGGLTQSVIQVFDAQISSLSDMSKQMDQETRVSVYAFGYADNIRCLIYDTDVLRLPSLAGNYRPSGMTALLDATDKAIEDLKHTPELYGDHAFLIFVITDGAENASIKATAGTLSRKISGLPENWTLAALVPDRNGERYAQQCGFPAGNIQVWDATSRKGVEDVGTTLRAVTQSYMTTRGTGTRGTSNLFQMNKVNGTQVKRSLDIVPASDYMTIIARKEKQAIKEVVESWTGLPYVQGSTYYRLDKVEKIQPSKDILVRENKTGKVYGGDNARQLLGLPNYEVKVAPTHLAGYEIFVKSTSTNRNVFKDTLGNGNLIVML